MGDMDSHRRRCRWARGLKFPYTALFRHRPGERITSYLAESTVNAVIGKRFAKGQQMQ
jgi:hypothetical protein